MGGQLKKTGTIARNVLNGNEKGNNMKTMSFTPEMMLKMLDDTKLRTMSPFKPQPDIAEWLLRKGKWKYSPDIEMWELYQYFGRKNASPVENSKTKCKYDVGDHVYTTEPWAEGFLPSKSNGLEHYDGQISGIFFV